MRKCALLLLPLLTLFAPPVLAQELTFSDVPENHIFKPAIEALKGDTIRGYADGTLQPERRVSRRELFVMVARQAFSEEDIQKCEVSQVPFPDFDKVDWGNKEICMGYQAGYITGDDGAGTLRPNDPIKMVESLKVITEARGEEPDATGTRGEWFAGYVKKNERAIPLTIDSFEKEVKRGELVETLWRLETNPTNVLHTSYEELSDPLGTVESCSELSGLVKDAWKQSQYLNVPYYGRDVLVGSPTPAMEEDQANGFGGGSDKSFSQTNIQEAGVDESDLIKTDGQYIFTAQDGRVKIIQAQPPTAMKELAQLTFDDFYPQEMYLHEEGGKKLLVLVGGGKGYSLLESELADTRSWRGFGSETQVKVLDVTLPSTPKTLHSFKVEGYLAHSRLLIGEGKVYIITNNSFNLWGLDKSEFEALKGEAFLPLMQVGTAEAKPALNCAGISYVKGFIQPESALVTALDLESGALKSQMMLGTSAQTIYMSLKNLYLTAPSQSHLLYSDFAPERDKAYTRLFKLSLSLDPPALTAQVPGWLLNQFSMSEHEGNFRVATTTGNLWWNDQSSSGVYILDSAMKLSGKVEKLAPGERIYSARFMGNRGYLVTFRQVDPLFALDLSIPASPKVVGELKIPGFSHYLHPFGENYLIGIGQDANSNTGSVQGPKVSLFDLRDPANLKEVDSLVLGNSGYSEAFYNHKAVVFEEDRLAEGEALLAFPVDLWDEVPDHAECSTLTIDTCSANTACELVAEKPVCTPIEGGGSICTTDGQVCQSKTFHQENFNGAVVFGVTEGALEEKARITHQLPQEGEEKEVGDWQAQVYRALRMGDNLFTLSRSYVQANVLDQLETVAGKLKLSSGL